MKVLKDTENEYSFEKFIYFVIIIIPIVFLIGITLLFVPDIPWFVPPIILAVGIGLLFVPYKVIMSVENNQVKKVGKSLLKTYTKTYPLDTIKRFTIRQQYSSSGRGGGSVQFYFGADFNTGILFENFFQVKSMSNFGSGITGAAISVARSTNVKIRGYDILEKFAKRAGKQLDFLDPVSAIKDGFSQVANSISGKNNEGNI